MQVIKIKLILFQITKMTQPASTIKSLDSFDCNDDPASIGIRWEKWKRGLEIYLQAVNIDDPIKKRATLLHTGGLSLQDVYYNIPGAHIEAEGVDVYNEVALHKLDKYFAPKQSKAYERHLFRLMKQEEGERFEKFLLKLRDQVGKCNFTDSDEHLIDQVVEKCNSAELRKRILSVGDTITLDQIIIEANALEAVDRQLQDFNRKNPTHQGSNDSEINKIDLRKHKSSDRKEQNRNRICSRYGSNKHLQNDQKCPAWDKRCLKCGFIGHFRDHCRTKQKRRMANNKTEVNPKKLRQDNTKTEEVDYIFHLDEDSVIKCWVGGVKVEMLIDSGSKCNVITDKTWQYLKEHAVKVSNQTKKPDKVFLPYGSQKPLDIKGSFEADIAVHANKTAFIEVHKTN